MSINSATRLISRFWNRRVTHSNYHFEKIDLCERRRVRDFIRCFKPDGVIHLAAESHVDNSILDPEPFVMSNIIGTFNLLEECRQYWHKVGLLEASSLPPCVYRRGLRHTNKWWLIYRSDALSAELALLGIQSGERPSRKIVSSYIWNEYGHYKFLEQFWSAPAR